MNTIEDFRNAPVGATATRFDGGRSIKIDDNEQCWVTPRGSYLGDEGMAFWNYTLDPVAPTTTREALDLVWNLAHEVKEGQIIPADTRYLESHISGLKENIAYVDIKISPELAPVFRTVDPLPESEPETEPDWLDALAVFAYCGYCSHEDYGPQITLHGTNLDGQKWECTECQTATDWSALSQVTPLYPKEGQEA